MSGHLFVTGNVRSGTTLIEKLLCNHSKLSVLAQPFPLLFIAVKNKFLSQKNIFDYFALSHYVQESRYTFSEFNQFLSKSKFSTEFILETINKHYSGNLTQSISYTSQSAIDFNQVYQSLVQQNAHNLSADIFGSKEVMCEEFVPYFLNKGIKVIHILRDPRDVIASIKKGEGAKYIGDIKPLLFELRNWRKSAQLALEYMHNDCFHLVHYEDLVTETSHCLDQVCNFLDIDPFDKDHFVNGIKDQRGNAWSSNSSFMKQEQFISTASVGRYKTLLSEETIKYIEHICYPELRLLNLVDESYEIDIKRISEFVEPVAITDKNIAKNYSTQAENIEYEIRRIVAYLKGSFRSEFLFNV